MAWRLCNHRYLDLSLFFPKDSLTFVHVLKVASAAQEQQEQNDHFEHYGMGGPMGLLATFATT